MQNSFRARPSFIARFPFLLTLLFALGLSISACSLGADSPTPTPIIVPTGTPAPTSTPEPPANTPASTSTPTAIPLAARGWVPVLCYHHIRNWEKGESEEDRAYIVPPSKLEAELKYLKDHGYHSVVSGQVYDYYAYG